MEDKDIELSENREEVKIETTSKTEDDGFDAWFKKVGEKTLTDAIKLALQYTGKLKLKYVAYALGCPLALILCGLIIYYLIFPLLCLIGVMILHSFAMTVGLHEDSVYNSYYSFFDSDLFLTVPVCLTVSIIVILYSNVTNFLFWLFYFATLVTTLEYWDYRFLETPDANAVLGGTCFFLFFVIIPVLIIVKSKIASATNRNKTETEPDIEIK
jgi:hypothetical protein